MEKFFLFAEKILPTMYGLLNEPSRDAMKKMFTNPNKAPKL